jgi:hypothetical protein
MFKTILFFSLILTVGVYADEEVAKIATAKASVSKNFNKHAILTFMIEI